VYAKVDHIRTVSSNRNQRDLRHLVGKV